MFGWLKTILGESYTEDIDKAVAGEIGKAFVAKVDFDAKNQALKDAQKTLTEREATITDLEGKAGDSAALTAEMEKLKGEWAAEKAAAEAKTKADQDTADRTKRFEAVAVDKDGNPIKWMNDHTRGGILAQFEAALQNDANAGKGDKDLFHELTKDTPNLFEGVVAVPLLGGQQIPPNTGSDDTMRRAMGLPTEKKE